jgi:hypothetical protein
MNIFCHLSLCLPRALFPYVPPKLRMHVYSQTSVLYKFIKLIRLHLMLLLTPLLTPVCIVQFWGQIAVYVHTTVRGPNVFSFLLVKGPAADATDAPQPWGVLCNPMMKMMILNFCPFPNNGAPVEWNWQEKTEVLGEKPVPVPLRPPQIPHGLTWDRTRASAVGGRWLTGTARPKCYSEELFEAGCNGHFKLRRPQVLSLWAMAPVHVALFLTYQ